MKRFLIILLLGFTFISCGKVSHVGFEIDDTDEAIFYEIEIGINSNSYPLPYFSLPLYDFKQGMVVGNIEVNEQNVVSVKLDSLLLEQLDVGRSWALPNGKPAPFLLQGSKRFYDFQIGNTNSRVYLTLDGEIAVFGLALNIASLKPTNHVGGFNALVPFSRDEVNGSVGLYFGNKEGQSGFAIFVDIGNLLNQKLEISDFVNTNRLAKNRRKKINYSNAILGKGFLKIDEKSIKRAKRKAKQYLDNEVNSLY